MMQRILTVIGIWLSITSSYAKIWTDCSEAFEPVEITTSKLFLPSSDYKVDFGKEFREALAGRSDIDWKVVQDNYREWSEHTTTLSGPARILVACVLSVVTKGMGTSEWLAGHGIAEGTASNAALSAGIKTLAASAGTSLAANLGDFSKAFDDFVQFLVSKTPISHPAFVGISNATTSSKDLQQSFALFSKKLSQNTAKSKTVIPDKVGRFTTVKNGRIGMNVDAVGKYLRDLGKEGKILEPLKGISPFKGSKYYKVIKDSGCLKEGNIIRLDTAFRGGTGDGSYVYHGHIEVLSNKLKFLFECYIDELGNFVIHGGE